MDPSTNSLVIGGSTYDFNAQSMMMIHDRALSQIEIQQIYCEQGGTGGFC